MTLPELLGMINEHEKLLNETTEQIKTIALLNYNLIEIDLHIEDGKIKITTNIDDLIKR